MIRKLLLITSHNLNDSRFYKTYRMVQQSQLKKYEELKKEQEKQLTKILQFSYKYVPYYHDLFKKLNLDPKEIKEVKDLEKLPVLTKEIIKRNWESLIPVNLTKIKYINKSTGGTTGTTLIYRVTKFERILQWAILYNIWGWSGYKLGDKVLILGGSSLVPCKRNKMTKFIYKLLRNFVYISAFDMNEENMNRYVTIINKYKPKIGYGYPSAWQLLAKFIKVNNLKIFSPSAIFTTSEKLYSPMRKEIEDAFKCNVYEYYGLNDGGISAHECPEHSGLHINTERSILEVIDEKGNQVDNGEGRILATSLYNYAMPFIRYETGDIGSILSENKICRCKRGYRRLKEIKGRSVDVLVSPEGKNIHGWFFLYIFWEYCKGIREYQVVQENLDKIVIKIVPESDFDDKQLDKIREIVKGKSEGWNLEFKFVDKIERPWSAKYKFIINKMK